MQMYKIKEMSIIRINQWLSAIGKLIKHYEGKTRVSVVCPLCYVSSWGCSPCPWLIIEGKDCEEFATELYPNANAHSCRNGLKRYKRWRIARLGQLRNWRKIFKAELARRDV